MIKTANKEILSSTFTTYCKKLNSKFLAPTTIARYTTCLRSYEQWLVGQAISEDSAQGFIDSLKQRNLSQSSIHIYYHAIKPLLVNLGITFTIKFKKHNRHPHPYSPDQIKAILETASNRTDRWKCLSQRDNLMILVFAYTGIRKGELMALRVRDINFYTGRISVIGKGDKERTIPIDSKVLKLLETRTKNMQPTARVFPLSSSRIGVIIKNYARAIGIPEFHCHSFRHFYATQLVKNGVRIEIVQELLGHADLSTTRIYVSVVGEDMDEAITHLPNLMEE